MKKINVSASVKWFFALTILLLALEAVFDWVEIGLGELMQITNRFRPQIGRLWDEEAKDQKGEAQIYELLQSLPEDSASVSLILRDLGDLLGMLSIRRHQTVERDEFLKLYRRLNPQEARTLVEPGKLYSLFRHPDWKSVNLILQKDQLALLFTDGFNQLLYETYVPVDSLYNLSGSSQGFSRLVSDDRFAGRIIPAAVFYRAFDRLTLEQRQNLVPDLYQLIEWGTDLKAVAISRVVIGGQVELAFEVKRADILKTIIIATDANAVTSLITKLNAMGETTPLMMPIEKGL